MLELSVATSGDDLREARRLFEEYADSLGFTLDFQNFERELAVLPGEYAQPGGIILLARVDGSVAGCVAIRRIDDETCEMKRLYVRPSNRRKGIGRKLAEAAIEYAHTCAYRAIRLDTIDTMVEANALYHSLGFSEIEPYRYNPIAGASYKELRLE
ncbi:MAG: GNAT family N-acetyltransferase [bacterium]|nr:MAG: GNAT family N-acetyltransferase [bacterium]